MLTIGEIIFRIVVSGFIGGLIGMEREANNRPAGLRTHVLVTLGSTLVMLISIDGFHGSGGDPARLAAQVVSGIGFLGAGTILRTDNDVKGLTTAASVWVSGCIGLAIGNGYYVGGIATAVVALFTLISLGKIEGKVFKKKYKLLIVYCNERPGLIGDIGGILGKNKLAIKNIKVMNEFENEGVEGDMTEIYFIIKAPYDLSNNKFFSEILNINGVEDVMWDDKKYSSIF